MKNLILIIISIAIYYGAVTSTAQDEAAPVRDLDGNSLRQGVSYYILPVIRGRGGGVTLSRGANKTCPLDVVQDRFEVNNGLPLTFSPTNPTEGGVVRESSDLNFEFSASKTGCPQSTVWTLDYFDEATNEYFITTGGVAGDPGIQTLSNWFRIDRHGSDYKLVFCPTVCSFCRPFCGDIGVSIKDGRWRLAVRSSGKDPFRVFFNKAA